MEIKHRIDAEFIGICEQIITENLDLNDWKLIESSDQFQTEKYCGGFDGTEGEFTFSYFSKNEDEYWFQLTLEEIYDISIGDIHEFLIRKAN